MDLPDLHRRVLADATTIVNGLSKADLDRPSTCRGWSVRQLVEHMIGQHHGFACAVRGGTADADEYEPRAYSPAAWRLSVADLNEAFRATPLDWQANLIEVGRTVPISVAVKVQIMDTAVHTWDLATSIARDYQPDDEVLAVVNELIEHIPDGPNRSIPAAPFAPAITVQGTSWQVALGRLGRRPSG